MVKTQNRDSKGKMRGWEQRLMAAILVIALAVPAVVGSSTATEESPQPGDLIDGGPVVLMGVDPEIGGSGPDHGPIESWVEIVQTGILDQVSNSGDGILVIGRPGSGVTAFWEAIGSGTDQSVTFVWGHEEILQQGFDSFTMVGVASSTFQLGSFDTQGLHNEDNNALIARAGDLAAFVNEGGGLLGFTQDRLQNEWGYIGSLGEFSTVTRQCYNSVSPTDEGISMGLTTPEFNFRCWHDTFTAWPDFLDVLAWRSGSVGFHAAALGGSQVVLVPPGAPGVPQNVTAQPGPGAGAITVSWDEPLDDGGEAITGYTVFGADTGEGPFLELGGMDQEIQEFTETGLANAQTRHYRVLASNEVGDGLRSSVVNATTFDVPGAPLDLTGDHGLGGVVLTWEPPMDDGGLAVTGYNVYAGEPGGGFSLIGTTTGTSFTEEDPPAVEQWSYRVTAVNEAGEGPGSDAITVELMILVDIEVNPENKNKQVNSNSRGNVRVAIYSTPDFDAPSQVDRSSLTFGATGDEDSLVHCHPVGLDVDGDGLRDLVCHFRVRDTGLASGDTEAVLKGLRNDGMALMGTNEVRVR